MNKTMSYEQCVRYMELTLQREIKVEPKNGTTCVHSSTVR